MVNLGLKINLNLQFGWFFFLVFFLLSKLGCNKKLVQLHKERSLVRACAPMRPKEFVIVNLFSCVPMHKEKKPNDKKLLREK